MHQPQTLIVLALLTLSLCAAQGHAQEEGADPAAESGPPSMRDMSPEERRAAFDALSEEDQQIVRKRQRAARDKQRAEWEVMTPAEREVWREEMRARAAKLTPEQRAAAREWREQQQKNRRNSGNRPPPGQKEDAVPPETG